MGAELRAELRVMSPLSRRDFLDARAAQTIGLYSM
jgi:hypothetical protein